MVKVRQFRELHVYQGAFEAAAAVFELTKRFPAEERFSLSDQMRRSSRSVCANIGESWRKRRYPAAFVSKLSDADAEATETQVWLDFALQCGYIAEQTHRDLSVRYDHIAAQLVKMMSAPEQWCNGVAPVPDTP
jgi:four helix bundle protein